MTKKLKEEDLKYQEHINTIRCSIFEKTERLIIDSFQLEPNSVKIINENVQNIREIALNIYELEKSDKVFDPDDYTMTRQLTIDHDRSKFSSIDKLLTE